MKITPAPIIPILDGDRVAHESRPGWARASVYLTQGPRYPIHREGEAIAWYYRSALTGDWNVRP